MDMGPLAGLALTLGIIAGVGALLTLLTWMESTLHDPEPPAEPEPTGLPLAAVSEAHAA